MNPHVNPRELFLTELSLADNERAEAFFRKIAQFSHNLGESSVIFLVLAHARQHNRVGSLAHKYVSTVVLDDQSHPFAIGVEWELTENFIDFLLSRDLVEDFDVLLTPFAKYHSALLCTLDEGKLVGTRRLIGRFIGLWIHIDNNCVAHGEKPEKVVQLLTIYVRGASSRIYAAIFILGGKVGIHEAFDTVDRALDHSSVLFDSLMDVMVGQVAKHFSSYLTFLELHFVLSQCTGLV